MCPGKEKKTNKLLLNLNLIEATGWGNPFWIRVQIPQEEKELESEAESHAKNHLQI